MELLLEKGATDKLLTDGGDGQPPEGLATAAPAEDPDHNRTFTGIVEQYHIDDKLTQIANAEQVAGPGFKSEAEHQMASTALKGIDVDAEFAAITGTPTMQEVDAKADAVAEEWHNPTDTGMVYEAGPTLADVNTVGDVLTQHEEVAQAQTWKPELSIVEAPKEEAAPTPEAPIVPVE